MKKLLLLAGILVVSGMTFAAEVNTEANKNLDVYAQVVTNLEIDTTPLNFGVIGINSTKTIPVGDAGAGSFTIKGATNTNIILTITDTDAENKDKFQNGKMTALLRRIKSDGKGDTAGNGKLKPTLEIKDNEGNLLTSNVVSIASTGSLHLAQSKKFNVVGTIETSDQQNTGNYKGAVNVKAVYEAFPKANN